MDKMDPNQSVYYIVFDIYNNDGSIDADGQVPPVFETAQEAIHHAKRVNAPYGGQSVVYQMNRIAVISTTKDRTIRRGKRLRLRSEGLRSVW